MHFGTSAVVFVQHHSKGNKRRTPGSSSTGWLQAAERVPLTWYIFGQLCLARVLRSRYACLTWVSVVPILGTIHASKGRESDTVTLVLPSTPNGAQLESPAEVYEEGRVYYVGATRAREELITARNASVKYGQLDSGRIYRKLRPSRNKLPKVQLEIGRENDVDRFAHLAWRKAGEIQRMLAESGRHPLPLRIICRQDLNFVRRLVLSHEPSASLTGEIEIGQMGEGFQSDIGKLWSEVDRNGNLRPVDHINHIYLVGATSVALSDGELSAVRPPYNRSGFALAPLIKGFPLVYFRYRKRWRS